MFGIFPWYSDDGPSGLRAGAARLRNGCESRGSSTLKGVGLSFAGPSSPFSCNSRRPQKTCPGTGLHPQNSDISLTPLNSYHGKWVRLKMGIPILLQLKLGTWWKNMKFWLPIFRLWISTRSSTDCEESFQCPSWPAKTFCSSSLWQHDKFERH